MLGVAQREALRSHWSSSLRSSSSVGPPTSANSHIEPYKCLPVSRLARWRGLALPPLTRVPLGLVLRPVDRVHGRGEIPHLYAAVAVAREEVATRPRAHAAGALALAHREAADGGTVHGLHLTHPARGHTAVALLSHDSSRLKENVRLAVRGKYLVEG